MKKHQILLAAILCSTAAQSQDFDFTLEEDDSKYNWNSPAGEYLDPSSFFSLHGYVNGVYANKSDEWTAPDPTQLGPPGQLLVPNTINSSFQYDFALIISSELSDRTRIALESHYVSNPSGFGTAGPGGITIAITEATASYDLIPKYLTFSGGLFWSPFGILNDDWLGAQNNFSLVPRASGAYPVHYNERGIRLNGVFEMNSDFAINYVVSVGNGVNNYNISGQRSFDNNDGKTFTSRIGVFPGMGKDLSIGFSFMNGKMREQEDLSLAVENLSRYENRASVFGIDLTYEKSDFRIRGYYLSGNEELIQDSSGSNPGDISRSGYMMEASYTFKIDSENLDGIEPKIRIDHIDLENLENNGALVINNYKTNTLSFGTNLIINDNFRFGFDYNIISETGQSEIDNNRFFGKVIAKF